MIKLLFGRYLSDALLLAKLPLDLVHGHIFMFAVLVPLSFCLLLFFSRLIGGDEIRKRSLLISFIMYFGGSTISLILMIAKGISMEETFARNPNESFAIVNSQLFGGSLGLRSALYGIFHVLTACGLLMFVTSISKSLWKGRGKPWGK
jgi:hypothetical protein